MLTSIRTCIVLRIKIIGGIKACVKEIIYPKDNEKDFQKFLEKYGDKPVIKGIKFHPVEDIQQVFKLVFL